MTRRTAATRHQDSRPALTGDEADENLLDVLMAFHHPTRRWLAEVLAADGPARVAELASRTGLAAGSVSHHLKLLHRYGFIEPAPELARETRESWWRNASRTLRWLSQDFEDGTVGGGSPTAPRWRTSAIRSRPSNAGGPPHRSCLNPTGDGSAGTSSTSATP